MRILLSYDYVPFHNPLDAQLFRAIGTMVRRQPGYETSSSRILSLWKMIILFLWKAISV